MKTNNTSTGVSLHNLMNSTKAIARALWILYKDLNNNHEIR